MSETREAIVAYIVQHCAERGYAPTVREIAAHVGLSSPASVQHHLRALEKQGRLVVMRNGVHTKLMVVPA